MSSKILLIGGHKDFNITRLAFYCRENKVPCDILRYHIGDPIDLTLEVNSLDLYLNGTLSDHSALFFRYDMFQYMIDNKDERILGDSLAIFETIRQYIMLKKEIKTFGRQYLTDKVSKIYNLHQAKEIGFAIPNTLISSNIIDLGDFIKTRPSIQKPIDRGSNTEMCDPEKFKLYREDFARPYLVQECLEQPEIRIYAIGEQIFAFQIIYEGIDYRKHEGKDITVKPIEIDADIAKKYLQLSQRLGMDYSAGDFMTGKNGELVFLEINCAPMFARADEEVGGAICKAMVDYLLDS